MRLTALNPAALAAGLTPDQALADARALVPDLRVQPRDRAAEAAALVRLARWCGRFSPHVAPTPPPYQGLMLDARGLAQAFGGEAAWLGQLVQRLAGFGLTVGAALAPTPGAACALGLADPRAAGPGGVVISDQALEAALAPLPLSALRLPARTVEGLFALGIKRVGEMARLPRASLTRRFGGIALLRLDQAMGRAPEPIDPLEPEARFGAAQRLAEPLIEGAGLVELGQRLAHKLCRRLSARGLGVRRLVWLLYRVDGESLRIDIGAAQPIDRAERLARLLTERLAALEGRLDLGFGIDASRLLALAVEPMRAVAQSLDPAEAAVIAAEAAVNELGDRLVARMGAGAVWRLAGRDTHDPFAAQVRVGLSQTPPPTGFDPALALHRPALIFNPPEPADALAEVPDGPPRRLSWRRQTLRVVRAEGPERIAPLWWCGPAAERDFYRIETAEGQRLWVMRQGRYAQGEGPRWFVAGAGP